MSHLSEIVPVHPDGGPIWAECMRIYENAFPAWEREWDTLLEKRAQSGRYQVRAGIKDGRVVGFYVLDVEDEGQNYALFSYLAIDETERSKGYGEELTRDAIKLFLERGDRGWLLIEAEERQAQLYGRIGFAKLGIDYHVPRYDGEESVPMNLMATSRDGPIASADGQDIKQIIERIYLSGYKLDPGDLRVARQLALIPDSVPLLAWPPDSPQANQD